MVDKIWYDWQKKHPENFWSYLGGTVPAHSQPGLYAQFPTGGPPFMNVSENLVLIASHPLTFLLTEYVPVLHRSAYGWNHEGVHYLRRHGYQEREVVLRL